MRRLTQASADAGNKLAGLEAIRFSSAVAILFWHYQHFAYIQDAPVNFVHESQPFYSWFSLFYNYGQYGVEVFWCISGFIFFWKYKDPIADRVVSGRKFFVLRFSRLYPLHFVTLLFVAVAESVYFERKGFFFVYQHNNLKHFVAQLLMASNWVPRGNSFNGPIWSVSIEVVAYCLFFATARWVGKSPLVNVAVIAIFAAARQAGFYPEMAHCFELFYAGGLAAIALQRFEGTRFDTILSAFALLIVAAGPTLAWILRMPGDDGTVFLFFKFYLPVVLYLFAHDWKLNRTAQKVVETAGNMTYASYLLHFPLQISIVLYFGYAGRAVPMYEPAFFCGYMAAVLAASVLVYRCFEMPAQRFIRMAAPVRLPSRLQRAPGA